MWTGGQVWGGEALVSTRAALWACQQRVQTAGVRAPHCGAALSELFSHLSLAIGSIQVASAALGSLGLTPGPSVHGCGGLGIDGCLVEPVCCVETCVTGCPVRYLGQGAEFGPQGLNLGFWGSTSLPPGGRAVAVSSRWAHGRPALRLLLEQCCCLGGR